LKINFGKRSLEKLPAKAKRYSVLDSETRGLGLAVYPSGAKTFFHVRKVQGWPERTTLGTFPEMPVERARGRASKLNGKLSDWKSNDFEGPNPFKRPPRVEVPLFRDLFEAYIQNHVHENANNPDHAEYHVRWRVKKHFNAWLDRKIDTITIEDVLAVKSKCGEHQILANRAVEFIRTLYNWSAQTKDGKVNFWPVANPAKDISLFEEKERTRFLQPVEVVRFNDCLKDEPCRYLKDFLTVALATGARKSNILAMRWADVSFDRRNWAIPKSKNGEGYDVNLTPAAYEVLERRRREIPVTSDFVFPSRGRTGHVVDLKKKWDVFRKRAEIPDVRIHDLRRTCGSYLAIAGVSLQQIGRILGHSSLQSTEIYARLNQEAVVQAHSAGETKMRQLMARAKRRLKLQPRQNLLAAGGAA
jgi:integrase